MTWLALTDNQITDLAPLIINAEAGGLGEDHLVSLSGNPLSDVAVTNQIPILKGYGIDVSYP